MTLEELGGVVATATGLTLGQSLFLGTLPETPDLCGGLVEYQGREPEYVFGERGIAIERPRVQLAFRGAPGDYATPRRAAEQAYQALADLTHQVVDGTRWLAARPLQAPFLLRRDPLGRPVVGFNAEIEKEVSTV